MLQGQGMNYTESWMGEMEQYTFWKTEKKFSVDISNTLCVMHWPGEGIGLGQEAFGNGQSWVWGLIYLDNNGDLKAIKIWNYS